MGALTDRQVMCFTALCVLAFELALWLFGSAGWSRYAIALCIGIAAFQFAYWLIDAAREADKQRDPSYVGSFTLTAQVVSKGA